MRKRVLVTVIVTVCVMAPLLGISGCSKKGTDAASMQPGPVTMPLAARQRRVAEEQGRAADAKAAASSAGAKLRR